MLSERPRLLFDYFTQLFAQVTNPPLDAIREELVTSLATTIGPEGNLLDPTAARLPPGRAGRSRSSTTTSWPRSSTSTPTATCRACARSPSRGLYRRRRRRRRRCAARLEEICAEVAEAIAGGARIIVLSDRHSDAEHAPIPSLLLTAAVHHHLIREKTRTQVGLLVEAGDVREVHHVALLIGYGAAAVNPYLAMESVEDLARAGTCVTGSSPRRPSGT